MPREQEENKFGEIIAKEVQSKKLAKKKMREVKNQGSASIARGRGDRGGPTSQ